MKIKEGRTVYVLLTDTGTLFTRLIRLFTKAPFNHASLVLDQEMEEVYSFGRKKANNPLTAGFVKENLQSELFGRAGCALFACTVSKTSYEQIRAQIEQFESNKDAYKYNLLGLFGVVLNRPIERKQAYFCTQFVAAVLQESGVAISEKPSSLVTPHDFEQTQVLQEMYRGSLQTLLKEQRSAESYKSA